MNRFDELVLSGFAASPATQTRGVDRLPAGKT